MDMDKIQQGVRLMLEGMGVDIEHPELACTPRRVGEAWRDDFLDGYGRDPKETLGRFLPAPSGQPVFAFDLSFVSVCPHHLLPFEGVAHLAYLPGKNIVGLSRLSKFLNVFAHRLVLQEELTVQLAVELERHLGAKGVGFVLKARHGCMALRGVNQRDSSVVTCHWQGEGSEHLQTLLGRVSKG